LKSSNDGKGSGIATFPLDKTFLSSDVSGFP